MTTWINGRVHDLLDHGARLSTRETRYEATLVSDSDESRYVAR